MKHKAYVKMISNKSKRVIRKERNKIIRCGGIILATIVLISSVIFIFNYNKSPQLDGRPAIPIEISTDENTKDNSKIFLERVESMKSGLYKTSILIFGEEKMRLDETVGESSKNFITVQGDFRAKYSIDLRKMDVSYDFNTEEVVLVITNDAIKVDSVELISDIKETHKEKSFGQKIIDFIPAWNADEELKELAIRQLLRNSKIIANEYDFSELQEDAEAELKNLIDKLNFSDVDYKIKFVESKSINIAK